MQSIVIMNNIFPILLLLYFTAVSGYRRQLGTYWINVNDEHQQEYRQNGRSCKECHFPFSYEDELYYGCRPYEDFQHACKNSNGTFIECPDICPLGSAHFSSISATSGPDDNSVVLDCFGLGSPNPSLTWKMNSEVRSVVEPPSAGYPVVVNGSITLRYHPSFYGGYSCHIDNEYSSASSEGQLYQGTYIFTGKRLPTIPTNLRVLSQTRAHVTLTWDYDEIEPNSSGRRTSYSIHMRPGRPQSMEKLDIVLIRSKSHTVKHLEPGVEYSFKVRRSNRYGEGLYSELLYYTLPDDAPIDRPVNLTVTEFDSTSVYLKWDFDGEDEKRAYRRIIFSPGLRDLNQSRTEFFYGNRRKIDGLVPNTKYTFEVEAIVSYIYMRKSDPVYVTTSPLAARITDLQVDDRDHNMVKIICKATGGPLPQITWNRDGGQLPDNALVNTSIEHATVISVLTLPRTALVYTQYGCEGSNAVGNQTRYKTVPYEGNHPPVVLEQNVLGIYEDLKKMKEDLGNDMKIIKEDLETLKTMLSR